MKIQKYMDMEPMKYWSLPSKSSDNQKKKLAQLVRGQDYLALLKKDGAWYRFIKGEEGELLLQSRTISQKTGKYVEKQDNVPHIIEELNQLPENTVLIGEICFGDSNTISSDVITIMGCLPAKAISRQKERKLRYYVFDILMFDSIELDKQPAWKRLDMLQKIKQDYNFNYIDFAEPVKSNLEEQIAVWLENGEEGAVLLKKDRPYTPGRSPAWNTIKFKQSLIDTLDLVIMGFTPPVEDYTGKYLQSWTYWQNVRTGEIVEGHYYKDAGYKAISEYFFKGLIGGFELGAYYGDKLVPVGKVANLTDEIRHKATSSPDDFLGTVVEVDAMSIDLERKSLRHAKLVKLRPDKNAKECLYEEIF